MSLLAPHLLAPTPSLAVVQMQPGPNHPLLSQGFRIARGAALKANLGRGEQTACEYRTAHDVELWPLEVASVTHPVHVGDLGDLPVASRKQVRSALRIKLRNASGGPIHELPLARLPLFLRGPEQLGMRLYELLAGSAVGLVARDARGARIGFIPH